MNHSKLDAGIPLLTEIIATAELRSAGEAGASTSLAHTRDWDGLGREIHEKVLLQLQERIDLVIEQRLAGILRSAAEGMVQQIRSGLHQALDEVISSAVALEIDNFQKTKI